MDISVDNSQSESNFTMSLPELEAALTAALDMSKAICRHNGMGSKDYLRAWRMVEEVRTEIAARCSIAVCAS